MEEFLSQMKEIQKYLLFFIEEEKDSQENFIILVQLLKKFKITERFHDLKSFLLLLSQVAQNHCHSTNFYDKIEQILNLIKNEITQFYTNHQIFSLFKSNKKILLFLIENQFLNIDNYIAHKMITNTNTNANYKQYFWPEIKQFLAEEDSFELPDNFYENRKIGENEDYISRLIRNDQVIEFISYTEKTNLSLYNAKIKHSIFETNAFLIEKVPNLIEYSAFYGSIQIFKYLIMNDVSLTPSIWLYAIHGNNPEIINFLEDKKIELNYECLKESIKCHHIDITDYILNNYFHNDQNISSLCIEFYNFYLLKNIDLIQLNNFCDLCKYDYFIVVDWILKSENIIDNSELISKAFFFAVLYENIEIIKLLFSFEKYEINYSYLYEFNKDLKKAALHVVVENENYEILKLLLSSSKINPNIQMILTAQQKHFKKTALHISIEKNNFEMVKLLLTCKKLDVNIKLSDYYYDCDNREENETDKSALDLAVEIGNPQIIKLLLSCDSLDVNQISVYLNNGIFNITETKSSAFHSAIESENLEIIQLFLSCKRIDINQKYEYIYSLKNSDFIPDKIIVKTALHISIEKENIEIIKLILLNENLDVNVMYEKSYSKNKQKTALLMAIEKNNTEIIKLLLSFNGIDVNMICKTIAEYEYDIKEEEKTALYAAIEKGNENIVKLLLSANEIDVNKKYKCCVKTFKKTDDEIEFYRTVVDCIKIDEKTPFNIAVESGNLQIIQLLLSSKNIDPNIKSITKTEKYYTSENIEKFIKEETALSISIEKENTKIVQFLLSCNKIDKNIKSKHVINNNKEIEKTLLDLAKEKENEEIINIIQSFYNKC